jgi:hypothetical protein
MAFWQIILIIVESICLVLLITLNIYRRKQLNKQASSNVDKDVISQKSPEVSKFTVQKSTINPSNTLSAYFGVKKPPFRSKPAGLSE